MFKNYDTFNIFQEGRRGNLKTNKLVINKYNMLSVKIKFNKTTKNREISKISLIVEITGYLPSSYNRF